MQDGIINGTGNSRYLKTISGFLSLYPTAWTGIYPCSAWWGCPGASRAGAGMFRAWLVPPFLDCGACGDLVICRRSICIDFTV